MTEKRYESEPFGQDIGQSIGQSVDEMLLDEFLERAVQEDEAERLHRGNARETKEEGKLPEDSVWQREGPPQKAPEEPASPPEGAGPPAGGRAMAGMPVLKRKRKLLKWVKIGIGVLIGAAIVFLIRGCLLGSRQAAKPEYETAEAVRRDLTVVLNGTGSISAAEEAAVIPLLAGEVQSVSCQEGDVVQKDDVLVTLDRADAEYAVNRAKLALSSAKDTYQQLLDSQKDMTITSTVSGVIDTLAIEKGDSVAAGMVVATVSDHSALLLKIPFFSVDCAQISPGDAAVITVNDTFETLTGTVDSVSALDSPGAGGTVVREVTIRVVNPGNLSPSTYATAMIGNLACSGSGTFSYQTQAKTILSKAGGEVSRMMVKEGSAVKAGQAIAVLASSSMDGQIRSAKRAIEDAELTLENAQKQLDNFVIKAPISGTVVEQDCDAWDILAAGTPNLKIYDLSYLTFEIEVDELDIPMTELGQEVELTADALPNETFHGVVEKIGMVGAAQAGVTTYPVTVRLTGETEGLMPGMNVDANISIGTYQQALTVPVDAVTRGNTVLVSKDSPSARAAEADAKEEIEGFVRIPVQLGAADEDYIIITGGLQEGDVLAVVNQETSSLFDMMTGGAGGMGGGSGSSVESGGESSGE